MPIITDKPLKHIVSTRLNNKDYEELINIAKLYQITTTSLLRKLVVEYLKQNFLIQELSKLN
jgi:Asp-tRNA(Asn)/Glu-tRNA(Gln) amidotransferase B subunit